MNLTKYFKLDGMTDLTNKKHPKCCSVLFVSSLCLLDNCILANSASLPLDWSSSFEAFEAFIEPAEGSGGHQDLTRQEYGGLAHNGIGVSQVFERGESERIFLLFPMAS
jgi:hypothetical protein